MPDATAGTPAADLLSAFRYVRGVYNTAARLLHATQPALAERGFRPYASWAAVWPTIDARLEDSDRWLRNWVIRQYYHPAHQNRDVVTLAAVLFDFENPGFREPILLGSRMTISSPNGSDPYWLGQAQRWSEHGPDGVVRVLSMDMPGLAHRPAASRAVVVDGAVLSLAIPLLEATDISTVEARVIDPLLKHPWTVK
jgi:hypothetical protein